MATTQNMTIDCTNTGGSNQKKTISSVTGGPNQVMAIDPKKGDAIVYVQEKTDGPNQKWNEASSGDSFTYQNVGNNGFMYPDSREQHNDGVRTKTGTGFEWTKKTVDAHFILKVQSGADTKAIKYMGENQPVQLVKLDLNEKAFQWDITS